MSRASRALPYFIYEDGDCRLAGAVPSLDISGAAGSAGAGSGAAEAGLTMAHMPSPASSRIFTVRVPSTSPPSSTGSSSSSSSSSSSFSSGQSVVSGGVTTTSPTDPHTRGNHRVFTVRVPSTSPPSSTGYPSSASSSSSGLSIQSGRLTTTPEAPRHRAGHDDDGHPMVVTTSAATSSSSSAAPFAYELPEQWEAHRRLADGVLTYKVLPTSHLRTDDPSNVPDTPAVESLLLSGRMKVFADEREWTAMEQDRGAPVMQDGVVDAVFQQQSRPGQRQQPEQLPTPAASPATHRSSEVFAETWMGKSFHSSVSVTLGRAEDDNTLETLNDSEKLNLVGAHHGDKHQPHRTAPHQPSPPSGRASQPHDAPGQAALSPEGPHDTAPTTQRVRGARVRKNRRPRRRRRTEIELTMYHAIRWLGMGDVVPNVSVVTGGPLVRIPLPCTFGNGPSGRKDEGEDFAVGLARRLVRNIEKRRAERARMMRKGRGVWVCPTRVL